MQTVSTGKAPRAIGPYSQAIRANGFIFCSGQIALDPTTGEMVGETIEEQTEQVMKNIESLLQACDATFNRVVKTTCFLNDINDFARFNEVYGKYFTQHLPARSAVGVASLPKGALVEVEIIIAAEHV